ncbi:MAG TPA: hypothetical protein IAA51_06775 [Candidatus Cottocaccamicrobium excrementipullorum]|nr:hypothetical protein [Candidatus Cottocaccamicrobium excrementipullorum]
MLYYFKPFWCPDYVLSCDKVRLGLTFLDTDHMQAFADVIAQLPESSVHRSSADASYHYLVTFGFSGCSFAVGFDFNGFNLEQRLKGFVEFNPNKILGDVWLQDGFFLTSQTFGAPSEFMAQRHIVSGLFARVWSCARMFADLELKRWDFAVDIPYRRSQVQLIKDRRKYSQFFRSLDDFTEYLGVGSNGGRVKVYNKKLEADLDYELTRIEVTLEDLTFDTLKKHWPEIYLRSEINIQSNVLVQLLQRCDSSECGYYLKQLNYRTRQKLLPLLVDKKFEVECKDFMKVADMVGKTFLGGSIDV